MSTIKLPSTDAAKAKAAEGRRLGAAADVILNRAKAEGRATTQEEGDEAARLLAQAAKATNDATRDGIAQLGKQLGFKSGPPTDDRGRPLDGSGQPARPAVGHGKNRHGGLRAPSWASQVKSYLHAVGSKDHLTPTGGVTVPAPPDAVVRDPQAALSLLDAIPSENLGSTDMYNFLRETNRQNNAAPVAVGATKPTTTFDLERVEGRAQTVAHLSQPIPRQYLADSQLLDDYLGSTLIEGVETAIQRQILYGDGESPNLEGLAETSGVVQVEPVNGSVLRTIRRALRTLEDANIGTAAAILALSPSAWERAETEADDEGAFLLGQPGDAAARRLWGANVVTTSAVNAGEAWLINPGSVQLYWRENTDLQWSESTVDADGQSLFARNLVQFRAEARVGFAVKRPRGVVAIALPAENGNGGDNGGD